MTPLFTRHLNLMQLLFSLTHGAMILTQKVARSSCKRVYELTSFGKEKGKSKGEGKFLVRSSCLPLNDRRQQLRELRERNECYACGPHDYECIMSPFSLLPEPQTCIGRMTTRQHLSSQPGRSQHVSFSMTAVMTLKHSRTQSTVKCLSRWNQPSRRPRHR